MKKMADISKEVQDFKTAIYGEDVRDSMVSLAEKINNEVTRYGQAESSRAAAEEARELAETQRQQHTEEAINDCNAAANRANEAAEKAEGVVVGDISAFKVTFQQAAERANIQSGDTLAVAFGKLAKFCADMQDYVFSPPVNNLLSADVSRPLSAAMGKQLQEAVESVNSALADNLNQNRIELTNSSYYPAAVCYRSGQMVYIKCAGTLEKEVPADAPYVVGLESMVPEKYRPNANIVAYPNISLGGKQIKLEIMTTGRVIFTSPEKLPVGFGLNMHFVYATGKSNF